MNTLNRTSHARIHTSVAAIIYTLYFLTLLNASEISSPPKGITDLKFNEFFINPIGPVGLEFTPKLRNLNGQRVRILGYIVHQDHRLPGGFLLTALPVQLHDEHYGLADDLPASTLFVSAQTAQINELARMRGPVRITGKLELGNREEADGRVSAVRLTMGSSTVERPRNPTRTPAQTKGGSADLLRRPARF